MKRTPNLLWSAALLASLLCLPACPSLSTLQTAQTIGQGQLRVAAAPGVVSVDGAGDPSFNPTTELVLRYGATDEIDLGLKIYSVGLQFDLSWQFIDTEGLDASVVPAISGFYFANEGLSGGSLYLHLAVLFGVNFHEDVTLGVGPKLLYGLLIDDLASSGPDAIDGLLGGIYVNLPIQLSPRFIIAPEINVYTDLARDGTSFTGLAVQGGIAVMFDFFPPPEPGGPVGVPEAPPGY